MDPGLTLSLVLTLAIGIGSNRADFNLANALLSRPQQGAEHNSLNPPRRSGADNMLG
jgi:hypothetical protein